VWRTPLHASQMSEILAFQPLRRLAIIKLAVSRQVGIDDVLP
jgi:hypothetical protein